MTDSRWVVPDNWAWAKAAEFSKVVGGGTPPSADPSNFSDRGYPWLTPADLTGYDQTYIGKGRRNLSEKGLRSCGATLMPKGAVLFSSRAPIGYCAVASNEICTNQGFKSFVVNSGILPEYIRYYLLGSKEYAESLASGTTFKELSGARVADLAFPIAPSNEQRRIIIKLDSLRVRSSRARYELNRIQRLTERYREAIFRSAFKGELTRDWRKANTDVETVAALLKRIAPPEQPRGGREATDSVIPGLAGLSVNHPHTKAPRGWQWTPLLRVARQETGHTPSRSKPDYWGGDIPWIGIKDANAHHGKVVLETIQTISRKGLDNSSARLLPKDTVCLSRTASVGYVTIMGRYMATSQDFATWTCTPALLPKFLMYALMAEGDDIRNFGEGSTHTTIYFPEIRALHICLPPIKEQAEIVKRVEKALAWVDKITAEYARVERLLPKLDQAILAKAFRGELVPQDSQDEPASVLLERISAQRGGKSSRRRGRARKACPA